MWMEPEDFMAMLIESWSTANSLVCVGLDTDYAQIPSSVRLGKSIPEAIIAFNRSVVEATHDLVCAFKINSAFYEAHGAEGFAALHETVAHIRALAPNVPIILDAKRADIGNTNIGYVNATFEFLRVDAITVHPYLGQEALQPFLDQVKKGVIVLCRTSNPGAGEFQDLQINGTPLWEVVAHKVASEWNSNGNCALVVGATYPNELGRIRKIVGDMPLLIPGIGAQGGDVEAIVRTGKDSNQGGMIINSSRGIIFASKGNDFARAARYATLELNKTINRYR